VRSAGDRAELMSLQFLTKPPTPLLVGPNGLGKSTIARNIAYQALMPGTPCTSPPPASSLDQSRRDRQRLRAAPPAALLRAPDAALIDEVGYLSYSNRHADLLFELINRRYEKKSTLVTTNKPFAEWSRGLPQRRLRRRARRSPHPSRRDHRPQGRVLPPQGSQGACRATCPQTQIRTESRMKTDHPPSGLLRGLDLLIDADWTPEQARAVIELLDDLRERIWAHYELARLFEPPF
jgi:hypothetical protein